MFDRKVFLNNIEVLMEENGIKASYIENKAGVTKGYISRLKREENNSIPGINFLLSISELFGISIEALSSIDLTNSISGDVLVFDFVKKIISNTKTGKIEWKKKTFKEMYIEQRETLDDHIIQKNDITNNIQEALNKYYYTSEYDYGDYKYKKTNNNMFVSSISKERIVCLTEIDLQNSLGEEKKAIELIMFSRGNQRQNICRKSPCDKKIYDDLLQKLYLTATEYCGKSVINDETKKFMSEYVLK